MNSDDITAKNEIFWNELCGTSLATHLGVTDSSPASLKKFDDWYFDFYPYLEKHIPFDELASRDVLEVGLGYGSVSQRLAERGARYTGLDVAEGPVAMANERIRVIDATGHAVQGSILEPPFDAESFDAVVAIGCLHHTGDLRGAIAQCRKLLRPGGKLIFMVYNAYSYRRWRMVPGLTLRYAANELMGTVGVTGESAAQDRAAYDSNAAGSAAPHTDWISKQSLRAYCGDFNSFRCMAENIDQEPPFRSIPRKRLLATAIPRIAGLDLYATATK